VFDIRDSLLDIRYSTNTVGLPPAVTSAIMPAMNATDADNTAGADEKIVYPPLSDDVKGGVSWRALGFFGAGAIMASVTIGSGETLFASRAGAIFGYGLLWCFVGGTIMKGIQVYVGARHMTLTGAHPMTHWGRMPGPRNWVPLVIGLMSLACFPFWLAGLPMMLGETINWIFGIDVHILGMSAGEAKQALAKLAEDDPARAELLQRQSQLLLITRTWGTIAIATAVTLTWLQTYRVLEKVQVFIVGLLLASLLAACFASQPDWLLALGGLIPSVPEYGDWIKTEYPTIFEDSEWITVGVCLGAIGGGTYDYLGYLGCFREKPWGALGLKGGATVGAGAEADVITPIDTSDDNLERGRRWLLPVKIDVTIGFLAVLVFTICFLVLGAVILHPDRQVPEEFELLSKQSRFLTDFHPSLLYLYQMGIFMAFWGTIYGAYEIYLRTAYECLIPISRRVREMPLRKFRAYTLIYCVSGALPLLWLVDNPMQIVKPAALLGGVFACGLWCFAMIWADRRFLPKPLQLGPIMLTLTAVSGAVLTVLGAMLIVLYVGELWQTVQAWF